MRTLSGNGLKIGIVGGGFMARTHAHAARAAGAHIESILSSGPESTRAAAAEVGAEHAAGHLTEVLERVDVVHITTPNRWHVAQALAAIESGTHVVCEKPIATTAADAVRLADAAASTDLVTAVPFVYRFHPMARETRARVAAGETGKLLTLRGEYLQDWMLDPAAGNWRVDSTEGGPSRAFADIGSHLVDFLEFTAGERITRLQSRILTAHPTRGGRPVETEDAAAIIFETTGGAIGTLLVSQVAAGRKNGLRVELSGTAGAIAFDQETPDTLWLGASDVNRVISRDDPVMSEDASRLSRVPSGHPMGYLDAFTAFAQDTYSAVRGERSEGLPSFADGARAARLTEAVLTSAATDIWIDTIEGELP